MRALCSTVDEREVALLEEELDALWKLCSGREESAEGPEETRHAEGTALGLNFGGLVKQVFRKLQGEEEALRVEYVGACWRWARALLGAYSRRTLISLHLPSPAPAPSALTSRCVQVTACPPISSIFDISLLYLSPSLAVAHFLAPSLTSSLRRVAPRSFVHFRAQSHQRRRPRLSRRRLRRDHEPPALRWRAPAHIRRASGGPVDAHYARSHRLGRRHR